MVFLATKEALQGFVSDRVMSLSASVSFYTLLSFAPLMVLAVWITSSIGPEAQKSMLQQISQLAGPEARTMAEIVIQGAQQRPSLGSFAGIAGIVLSLIGATTVFAQLQMSLNRIWGIEAHPGNAVWGWVRRRILSVGVIAAIGFVVIASLVMSAIIGIFLKQTGLMWDLLNQLITALVFTGLFTLLFRYLPDAQLPWKRAFSGGVVTAVLFTLGKTVIGLYLASASVGGAYGAAGSIAILMVWVYYSSAIFFFGAEFVQAWVNVRGEEIPLAKHATRIGS